MLPALFLLVTCVHRSWAAVLFFNASISKPTNAGTYRAAVYEHAVIFPDDPETVLSRSQALALMRINLAIYEIQAKAAANKGAHIIVFPEDGLYGWDHTRESKLPYLETIPDPERVDWNPCDNPDEIAHTEVQHTLSCMAKEHRMYLVANMGQLEPCFQMFDPKCPDDGRYQFNTNVVYDPNGNFLVRYRKYYLYHEPGFDVPPKHELKTFDTPFGRFGTFTCADIIYKTPAVDLVEELSIKNIAFPTAWENIFPYNVAIQAQQGFATVNGVNLLAADVQNIGVDIGGSGIYSSSETIQFVYRTDTDKGTLLIGDVPSNPSDKMVLQSDLKVSFVQYGVESSRNGCLQDNKGGNSSSTVVPSPYFSADMTGDEISFVALTECEGKAKVCNGSFCCSLEYKFRDKASNELYALGAWSGLHTFAVTLANQVCTVVKCGSLDRSSCGSDTRGASSTFDYFVLDGNFKADMVYPRLLTVEGGKFDLSSSDWVYSYGKLTSTWGFQKPLLSATLYGRFFYDVASNL